jgi:cell division protein FtsQ
MERSLGVLLGRPLGLVPPGRGGERGARSRRSADPGARRSPRARGAGASRLRSRERPLFGRVSGHVRAPLAFAWEHRRLRRGLLIAIVALVVLAGGWLWLRQSPLVSVEHVQVQGLSVAGGRDAGAIEAALRHAADGMSTLELSQGALRAAVASYPIVRSIQAHASFPHSLRIDVVEQPPVATLEGGGERTAAAADGVLLGPQFVSGALTVIHLRGSAQGSLPIEGRAVRDGALREELALLGVAPRALASAIERVYMGRQGLTIVLRGGVRAYFGDASRPHAKWLSLARVLADPSSQGAVYVDVRLPERPAAGFPPGVSRPDASSEGEAGSAAADPATAAALASGLQEAVGGGAASAGSAAAPASPTSPAASQLGASLSSEASSPAGSGAESDQGGRSEQEASSEQQAGPEPGTGGESSTP